MFWSKEIIFLMSSMFIISSTLSGGRLTYLATSSTDGIFVLFSDRASIASFTFDRFVIVSLGVLTILALSLK